ncbi:MAG: DUF3291 domain-containing protein [Pseudomonadota bacterium]
MTIAQPQGTHLAQLNVGRARGAYSEDVMQGFTSMIDTVNGIAKASPGFVWMLEGDAGVGAMDIQTTQDPLFLVNLSVWTDAASLENFVWNGLHERMYQQKAKWFEVMGKPHFVMWFVPEGDQPTPQEALERLDHYRAHGNSDHAFGWDALPHVQQWQDKRCG